MYTDCRSALLSSLSKCGRDNGSKEYESCMSKLGIHKTEVDQVQGCTVKACSLVGDSETWNVCVTNTLAPTNVYGLPTFGGPSRLSRKE